jgi:hypothetical protein
VRTELGYEVIVGGESVDNALVVLSDDADAAPVDVYGDPFSALPLPLPILSDASGWVRGWLGFVGNLRLSISDNGGLAVLVSDPSQSIAFDPYDAVVLVPGADGGNATVCRTILVSGNAGAHTTAATARRVSLTWDNSSSNDAVRPSIDGTPLAPANGPATIIFGTLDATQPLPQMLIETHQNNDSVTVMEED